jgi:glutamate-ammonia-ligase adenylyltransferase
LSSYAAYYQRWSLVWESQALLRADVVAGDESLGQRFLAMIGPYRWRPGGLSDDQLLEVRRLKARVESERLPRGADPALHTKLGRGGLADVEWTVQLVQLRHAHHVPSLRTTGTIAALHAAEDAGLVSFEDAETLRSAWLMATRVRNAIVLVRGRSDDSLPRDIRELAGVARLVGYAPSASGEFIEDYRRITRRARAVVERVFYQ